MEFLIRMDTDGAYRFVAAIVRQLRLDTALHIRCETVEPHPVNVCSNMFLATIDEFASTNKDPIDISLEVLRLHTWLP